jgi:hypothetical protein
MGSAMSKHASREFYLARVLDHETAAAECGDPMMRQIWQATAAEWREVSQSRPAPRRRQPRDGKGQTGLKWDAFMAAAPSVGADAVLAFRDRDQIELLVGQSLLMGALAGAAPHILLESEPSAALPDALALPQVQEFDLIL